MAEDQAPNQLPEPFQKRIARDFKSSVFFIMITPRQGRQKTLLKARIAEAEILTVEEGDAEMKRNRVGAGFVVEAGQHDLKIMTCAHLIDYTFTARQPISADEANSFFKTEVLCDHAEVHYTETIAAGGTTRRAYSLATILDIDCEKDLMLLQMSSAKVYRCFSATNRKLVCSSVHPVVYRSLQPPEAFDRCAMISWPAEKHNTAVKGTVSHCSRTIKVMAGDNLNGYSMKLLQVDIRSEQGASGSALFNEQAECIGVLHGGDVQFTYFVSLEDLSEFLDRNGVPRRI